MPSLLEDILAESHLEAIESGNLRRPRGSSLWKPDLDFKPAGYAVSIDRYICGHCGASFKRLVGAFSLSRNARGDSLRTALDLTLRLPPDFAFTPKEITTCDITTPRCALCILN